MNTWTYDEESRIATLKAPGACDSLTIPLTAEQARVAMSLTDPVGHGYYQSLQRCMTAERLWAALSVWKDWFRLHTADRDLLPIPRGFTPTREFSTDGATARVTLFGGIEVETTGPADPIYEDPEFLRWLGAHLE